MNTVIEALSTFPRWMNRPLARVHVHSWRVALLIDPIAALSTIRYVPAHRSPDCRSWRCSVARTIRIARKSGRIKLPRFNENSGLYTHPH